MKKKEELQSVHQKLILAECPEDIFGDLTGEDGVEKSERVKNIYRDMTRTIFPDHFRDDDAAFKMAEEALRILNSFRIKADQTIEQRTNGNLFGQDSEEKETLIIKKQGHEYRINVPEEAEGDISLIYSGIYVNGDNTSTPIVIKVVKDPADAILMQNEARILKILHSERSNQGKHFPVIIDQFRMNDKKTLILKCFDGYDLRSVREEYKNGLDQKHAAWILNRILSGFGYVHSRRLTHNKINPSHIMLCPENHNAMFLDWSYATYDPFNTGESFQYYDEDYSAPEVKQGKLPTPSSDLYSIGKCMIYILGGDIKTNTMPRTVDERFQRFIRFFVMESPIQRANDAWEMHEQLRSLRREIWGPDKFVELKMKSKQTKRR